MISLQCYFHEIFVKKCEREFSYIIATLLHHSVEIAEILSHTFLQKFRESNGFTKEITK